MAMNAAFLEEGEIESDADDCPWGGTSVSSKIFQENCDNCGLAEGTRNKYKEHSLERRKRRRRRSSRERSNSKEPKVPRQLDSVEVAEMDEYEMLCIRGASPPHAVTSTSAEVNFQRLLASKPPVTYYEYERTPRYDSDDDAYARRQASPMPKRRKDRVRRRQRHNRRISPEHRSTRGRSNSVDEQAKMEDRKMEICKFYLLDCCVKRSICRYMHGEFPCKYFYLGLECQNEKLCKFSHGKALTQEMTLALARHIAAAPKAILGNFKRYSRDRALMMIDAKNRQLDAENGIAGKNLSVVDNQSKVDESSPSSSTPKPAKHPQDVSAIFSAQQIEKLTALGIGDLRQVKQMSLAQLTDIGLSLSQIGDIQKTKNDQKSLYKGDMDMRQLLPSLPTANDDRDASEKIISERKNELGNQHQTFNQLKVQNPIEAAADALLQLLDDEPELVIDETVDEASEKIEDIPSEKIFSEPLVGEGLQWEPYFSETMDYKTSEDSKIERNEENDDNVSSISSDGALFDSISFDEPFETADTYTESNHEGKENKATEQSKSHSVLSDYDMRLPFADSFASFVPSMEIDASMKSHLGILYKLNEVIIPSKKDPVVRTDNVSDNTLDPRLKKLLLNKSRRTEENNISFHLDGNNTLSLVNPYKHDSQQNEISADPRKRKDQSSEANTKHIQQNFNYVLNTFLQKSKWYQNLNSKSKIEINQHLADLSSELNKFSLTTCHDKQFQMSSIANFTKIDEILCEIGLEVNSDGILQEWKPPNVTKPAHHKEGLGNDIPSLLNMSQNVIPVSTSSFLQKSPLLPNIPLILPSIPRPPFEFLKPGLLGIAPGIEGPPPFLHGPHRMSNYNNALNPQIWNNPPANYAIPPNFRQICSGMDEMNRNQFPMQIGKGWNRNLVAKRPRRI